MKLLIPVVGLCLLCAITAHAGTIKVNSQTVTTPIKAQADTVYDVTGSVLTRNSGGWIFVIPNGVNNVTIKGGELIGGGIKGDKTDGTIIDGVTIRNTTNAGDGDTGGHSSAISFMGDFTNGRIQNCRIFKTAGTAVFLFCGFDKSVFTRNLIDDCNEGIHWFGRFGPTNNDPEFSYNTVLRARRHAYEFQCYGKTYGLKILNNYAGEWVTNSSPGGWNGHMAFSIAMGGRQSRIEPDKGPGPYINEGMLVAGNVADTTGDLLAKFRSGITPWFNSVAYELMGDGFTFRNNFSNGWAHSTLVEYVGPGWTIHDNVFLSQDAQHPIKKGASGSQASEVTQGVGYNSPPLRMDNFLGVVGDKPVPPSGHLADTGAPPPPIPAPNPAMVLSATAASDTTVQIALVSLPSGTLNVRIKAISTVGGEPWPTPPKLPYNLPANGIVGPYPTNWRLDFTAEALNASGAVISTSNTVKDVQVKKPVTPPPPTIPPIPQPQPTRTRTKGIPYDVEHEFGPDGAVTKSTTRPAQ